MTRTRFVLATGGLVAAALLAPGALAASKSGVPAPLPPGPRQQLTPEQQADALYNDGLEYRDKATKYDKEAAAEADAKKKGKLEAKAKDKYQDAARKFSEAVKKNPNHYSAWGNLGYAFRKTGDYAAALEAYGKAIALQPGYTPAIEYRAEAYLALNRLDDVKSAYMALFNMDRPRADELAAAIEKWLEKRKSDPAGLDPARLDEFAKWAEQRKQLASQVSSVLKPKNERW
jgi:tetratricopeptide (TPR) repeat protein